MRCPLTLRIGAAAVGTAVLLAGCGRSGGFADRTAVVTLDGSATTYTVASCGLDGRTAFVVGRTDDGQVLQAVIGVAGDHTTGVPASTGISVSTHTSSFDAFGAESWQRRGEVGAPPGTITFARIKGARIQARGTALPVDEHDQPTGAKAVDLSFDARCDAGSSR